MNTKQFLEVARKVNARRARAREQAPAAGPYRTGPERIYTPGDGPPPLGTSTYSPPPVYDVRSSDTED